MRKLAKRNYKKTDRVVAILKCEDCQREREITRRQMRSELSSHCLVCYGSTRLINK